MIIRVICGTICLKRRYGAKLVLQLRRVAQIYRSWCGWYTVHKNSAASFFIRHRMVTEALVNAT